MNENIDNSKPSSSENECPEPVFNEEGNCHWIGLTKEAEAQDEAQKDSIPTKVFQHARLTEKQLDDEEFKDAPSLIKNAQGHGDPIKQGEYIALFGDSGIGKTIMSVALARAIASGSKFGFWNCHKSPVYYIDGEMGGAAMKAHISQFRANGDFEDIHILTYDMVNRLYKKSFNLYHSETLKHLFADIQSSGAKVVILDNLQTLFKGCNLNEARDFGIISDFISKCKAEMIAVIISHHANKSGAMKGSTIISDQADLVIHLKDAERLSLIDKQGNSGANVVSSYQKKRRFLPNKQYEWFFPVGAPFPVVKEVDDEMRVKQCISQGNYKDERYIAEACEMETPAVRRAVYKLEDRQEITRDKGIFKVA